MSIIFRRNSQFIGFFFVKNSKLIIDFFRLSLPGRVDEELAAVIVDAGDVDPTRYSLLQKGGFLSPPSPAKIIFFNY